MRDAGGAVAGVFAIGRNCTACYAAENALKARVAELEKALQARSS